jgi:solute carrier family 25 (mitochondrial folate transporter), member 32
MASLFAFAGAGGGLVASIATCPLDVIKTKLQAQTVARGHAGYLGVLGASSSSRTSSGMRHTISEHTSQLL